MGRGTWALVLSAVGGCLWVSPAEHRANQAGFAASPPIDGTDADADGDADTDTDTDVDGDTDTDADVDGDTDVDADTDTDTDPPTGPTCVDDPFEPNDVPADAWPIGIPGALAATTCPNSRLDRFTFDLVEDGVLDVALDSADCAALLLTVAGPWGSEAQASGDCPTWSRRDGPATYEVRVTSFPAGEHAYEVQIDWTPCRDVDGDGFDPAVCDGTDCDDADPTVHPGAPEIPGDLVDQDCDGGDTLPQCPTSLPLGVSAADALPCGDPAADAVWDLWEFAVAAGDAVDVHLDTAVLGNADLYALLVDPDGTSHLGSPAGGDVLDDDGSCLLQACPAACAVARTSGAAQLWVAQHAGGSCEDGAAYELRVEVAGSVVSPALVSDDVALGWP